MPFCSFLMRDHLSTETTYYDVKVIRESFTLADMTACRKARNNGKGNRRNTPEAEPTLPVTGWINQVHQKRAMRADDFIEHIYLPDRGHLVFENFSNSAQRFNN